VRQHEGETKRQNTDCYQHQHEQCPTDLKGGAQSALFVVDANGAVH